MWYTSRPVLHGDLEEDRSDPWSMEDPKDMTVHIRHICEAPRASGEEEKEI